MGRVGGQTMKISVFIHNSSGRCYSEPFFERFFGGPCFPNQIKDDPSGNLLVLPSTAFKLLIPFVLRL